MASSTRLMSEGLDADALCLTGLRGVFLGDLDMEQPDLGEWSCADQG